MWVSSFVFLLIYVLANQLDPCCQRIATLLEMEFHANLQVFRGDRLPLVLIVRFA